MKILVVEDEYNLADVLATRLEKEKYVVDIETNGSEGLYAALSGVYDLILLDVMLPEVNGYDILKEIRKNNVESKVIMLTAKSELDDKLEGLTNGADDYITKPFHIEEVIARVNIQLKKGNNQIQSDYIEVGNLRLNLKTSTISCIDTNESIEIGCKEFQLLEYLMKNKDIVISKEQIYNRVWGIDNEIESNNLEAYMSFIRKKIKVIGSNISIKALRGLGYKLEVVDEEVKE